MTKLEEKNFHSCEKIFKLHVFSEAGSAGELRRKSALERAQLATI
jgi:hypothetical protein